MITTTFARIRAHSPCVDGWRKLLATLGPDYGDETPVTVRQIVESNGLDDALWCLRTMPEHDRIWRGFAVDCAERVRHLMTDLRSLNALDVARRHANGAATDEELNAAGAAAGDAAGAAAGGAARGAAWDAARGAAWDAARGAAWNAARGAAWDAARAWQKNRLLELCEGVKS